MHILCVTSSYPLHPASVSGAFVQEWAQALCQGGHTLDVLTWRAPETGQMPSSEGISITPVPYASLPERETLFHGAGVPENVSRRPAILRHVPAALIAMSHAIDRAISRRKPDLLIAHWLFPGGYMARRAALRWKLPLGIVTHAAGIHLLQSIPHQGLRRFCARQTFGHTPMTAVSPQNLARLKDLLGPRADVTLLPMGFSPHRPSPCGPKTDLLIMGRLVPIKRVALALRAIGHIHPPPVTHVLGDGPLRGALEAEAGAHVTFHGVLKGQARAKVFDRCGVSVFASGRLSSGREEGLPVSFLEACDAGILPCVAHLPGAHRFLVDPASQRLLDPADAHGWARQIEALLRRAQHQGDDLRQKTKALVAPLGWPQLGPAWCSWVQQVAKRG